MTGHINISTNRRTRAFLLFMLAMIASFNACLAQNDPLPDTTTYPPPDIYPEQTNWLNSFDIDGDSINDSISFSYTGGAHCCYLISISLSCDHVLRKYPFEMDGGYLAGVDNSQPEQFDIRDTDHDGLPEILMKIQTYNLRPYPIPKSWRRKYGIHTNNIIIEYCKGKLLTHDNTEVSK